MAEVSVVAGGIRASRCPYPLSGAFWPARLSDAGLNRSLLSALPRVSLHTAATTALRSISQ
jgi:hypothetical protein